MSPLDRPEPPACSHWSDWSGGQWCATTEGTRRYSMGWRCEEHAPGQPGAQR